VSDEDACGQILVRTVCFCRFKNDTQKQNNRKEHTSSSIKQQNECATATFPATFLIYLPLFSQPDLVMDHEVVWFDISVANVFALAKPQKKTLGVKAEVRVFPHGTMKFINT